MRRPASWRLKSRVSFLERDTMMHGRAEEMEQPLYLWRYYFLSWEGFHSSLRVLFEAAGVHSFLHHEKVSISAVSELEDRGEWDDRSDSSGKEIWKNSLIFTPGDE